ncbi:C-type lectin domain family 4 member E-like [Lates japonicus]|uniref:C-type lectin domain family 4 member E-like protein n=1 Tax=Lates japonicus TaxID=270547 RepID=A0AAD3RCM8_LATJO|nr:C-type lectin domain family 4 member E-like protein [Lates japonicus]
MMNLVKTKGHIVLCVLVGLLISEAYSETVEEELAYVKLRLHFMKNLYKKLCNQYSEVAANCSAPAVRCSECPEGWFQVGDQCFILRSDKMDWANSQKNCTESGGHLAILTNREELDAVERENKRIGNAVFKDYWIGLTDIENEGHWKWVDNSTLKVAFWDTQNKEPDNNLSGGQEGEDCVVVDSTTETWFDVPCSFMYPRICQMDATPFE